MVSVIYITLGVLIFVICFLGFLIVWRELFFRELQSSLTDKLMSKDYQEYSVFSKPPATPKVPEVNQRRSADGVLGKNY